ncbi:MAG: Thermostable carboxypeptidase 1 [Candidatus Bipolaricaulis sibiricus]|uniref:Metal-dependent carboxypeptidase n=1 Tax=Bipolaricaulis sibiricus TaxID=2501609 RepID=A0A410FV62_BIPS1|nr:MAG: Thermostable carboxypeptidase 1 [Candidatus Bipolaricaulis sibiricus]
MSALQELRAYVREITEIQSAAALCAWDQRTHMPEKGGEARAKVLGRLERMAFERVVSDRMGELLADAERSGAHSEVDRALIRVWKHDHTRNRAIPPALYQKFVETTSRAESVWEKAKAASDFGLFRPHLAEVVDLVREITKLIGFKDSPYDALLDEYEPGMTVSSLRPLLASLRTELVAFLRELSRGRPPRPLPSGTYPIDAQREMCREALGWIGYDFGAGRLDDSAHPFTIGVGVGDVRVTNRYQDEEPFPGLFGALHEGGHALYAQGTDPALAWTGLAGGASFGIHESQSRFWENQIGRSRAFWAHAHPRLVRYFPHLARTTPDDVWRHVNRAEASLIRVEADEVTYNLHICLRFEIEVDLIEGRLGVDGLPERWNQAMADYLGVTPPDDRSGVLQDVHWSGGMFGYFPSYALGNLYGAQITETAEREIPGFWDKVRTGQLTPIREWLRENVHRHGRVYLPEDLVKRVTGSGLSAEPFLRYIRDRYGEVYGL